MCCVAFAGGIGVVEVLLWSIKYFDLGMAFTVLEKDGEEGFGVST